MSKYTLAVISSNYYATEKEFEFTDEPSKVEFLTLPAEFYTEDTKFEDVVNAFIEKVSEDYTEVDSDEMKEALINEKRYYPEVVTPDCCDSYVYNDTSYAFEILDVFQLTTFKQEQIEKNINYIEKFQKEIEYIDTFTL